MEGKVWRHKVRVFQNEGNLDIFIIFHLYYLFIFFNQNLDIIYVVMAFGIATSAQKYLNSVHQKFVERYY